MSGRLRRAVDHSVLALHETRAESAGRLQAAAQRLMQDNRHIRTRGLQRRSANAVPLRPRYAGGALSKRWSVIAVPFVGHGSSAAPASRQTEAYEQGRLPSLEIGPEHDVPPFRPARVCQSVPHCGLGEQSATPIPGVRRTRLAHMMVPLAGKLVGNVQCVPTQGSGTSSPLYDSGAGRWHAGSRRRSEFPWRRARFIIAGAPANSRAGAGSAATSMPGNSCRMSPSAGQDMRREFGVRGEAMVFDVTDEPNSPVLSH